MIKNKIYYLLLLIVLWLLRILYAFRITAVIFYVFLLLPPVLLLLLFFQVFTTSVEVAEKKRIVNKTTPFQIEFRVESRSFLPPGKMTACVYCRNAADSHWNKKKVSFFCTPGKNSYYLTMTSDYCAEYEFRVRRIRFYDILCLFSLPKRIRKKQKKEISVTVMPRLQQLSGRLVRENPHVLAEGELYSDTRSGDDPAEIFQIREYVEGDHMNRIHWKLSAREGELMVKEFGLPVDCSVLVLLDSGYHRKLEEQLKYRDAVMEAALSISSHFVQEGQIHFLAWYDAAEKQNRRYRITDAEAFYISAGELLRSSPALQEENIPLQYLAEYEKEQYTNIFYITGETNPEESAEILVRSRKSAWVTLVVITAGTERSELEVRNEEGVTVRMLSPEQLGEDMSRYICMEGEA